jgi:uncharacterized protein involved in outer membrane biogenesis
MIKWLFKWVIRLGLLAVVLVILFLAFKDSVLRTIAEQRIRSQTGMEVKIGKLSSGLFTPIVTLENLKLYNTAEFGGTLFLDVPEIHIELDAIALAQHKLRMKLVRFNLAEINVVRNEAGQTNITSLVNKTKTHSAKDKQPGQILPGDLKFDGIDVLNLSLGKAKFIDLKDAHNNREIKVGLENQVFKDVRSEADVYAMLFMIWLRSGGKFSMGPNDLARDYVGRKADKVETVVRQVLEKPAAPPRKP